MSKWVDDSLPYFSSLVHCVFSTQLDFLQDLLISCKELRYLIYIGSCNVTLRSSALDMLHLQHLCFSSIDSDIPENFMATVYQLMVDWYMYVRSVTSEGIITLINNSPNLIKFYIKVCRDFYDRKHNQVIMDEFKGRLWKMFPQKQLLAYSIERIK